MRAEAINTSAIARIPLCRSKKPEIRSLEAAGAEGAAERGFLCLELGGKR